MSIQEAFLDISGGLRPEVISSLIVIFIIVILSVITSLLARKADPLKKPRGLLFIVETGVNFFDNMVSDLMGKQFKGFGGYFMAIATYLFLSFIFGLTGLPSPVTNLAVPLTLALMSFVIMHATSVKYTKMRYFKRFVDPLPVMLPINLISMWAPLLSWCLRLFGNAVAGWTLMTIVYGAFANLSEMIFSTPWASVGIAPLITPVLHMYFDLFSAFIQTTIFLFLSMLNIAAEAPEELEDNI